MISNQTTREAMYLVIPYIIGVLVGLPIALLYKPFREKQLLVRLGLGTLVGLGIAVVINASLELLTSVGERESQPATAVKSQVVMEEPKHETKATVVPADPKAIETWEQVQRYGDGTMKAMRTVIRDSDGSIIPHGPATTHFSNGQLKWTGTYEMGRQSGAWVEYYSDGTKEGEGDISKDGIATERHWHNNGKQKSNGTWLDGRKHGEWTTWYPSGQQAGVYHYSKGKLHGDITEWHANGQKKLEGQFEMGVPRVSPER